MSYTKEQLDSYKRQDEAVFAVLEGVFRALWAGRVELGLLAPSVALWAVLAFRWDMDKGYSAALALLPWVPVMLWRRPRVWVYRTVLRAIVRRTFLVAVKAAGVFPTFQPRVLKVRELPVGHVLTVEVPRGGTVTDIEKHAEGIAASMQVRDVKVTRDPANARRGRVVVFRRDPLSEAASLPWPLTDYAPLSLWEPLPVGINDDGAIVCISLAERNLLLGGEPGAGKSVALSLLVAAAALDPNVRLYLLDGKLVELAAWRDCAEGSAGVSVAEANELLRRIGKEMEDRYLDLLAHKKRKVERGDGLPLIVVVCDELAHYLTSGTRDERNEFTDLFRDLVSRGRAAGVIVLAATQKPGSDVVPTSLRDLFGFRWALRCSTPQASDTILGSGWAAQGYSASDVDAGCRGIGFLLHEGGVPVRLRSYHLDDRTLHAVADRAAFLRRQGGNAA